jgi:serine/threonine-protein kinase ULK4
VGDVQGQDEFQSTLLQIVEVLSQQPGIMLAYPDIFIEQVLPSLAVLYKKNTDGDMRFLCLKVFFDLLVVFLDNISSANSLDSSELPETTGMGALRRYIFPSGLRYDLIALNQCTPFCILNSV